MALFLKFLTWTHIDSWGQSRLGQTPSAVCKCSPHTPHTSQHPTTHLKALGRAGAREGHIRLPLCKAAAQVHCHLPTSVRPSVCASKGVMLQRRDQCGSVSTARVSSVYRACVECVPRVCLVSASKRSRKAALGRSLSGYLTGQSAQRSLSGYLTAKSPALRTRGSAGARCNGEQTI